MTQTIESKGKRVVPTVGFFLDRLWVWITGILFWALGALFLWAFEPIRTNVSAIWEAPAKMAAIQNDVAALRADLRTATGANRVIRQTSGLSYVTEPVHAGEPVVLNLVLERTELGVACVFVAGQSLFGEAGGMITPGSDVRPIRQIGEEQTRMQIKLTPPDNLRPGRVELHLALEYDCDGRRVFDRTDVVTYHLLDKP